MRTYPRAAGTATSKLTRLPLRKFCSNCGRLVSHLLCLLESQLAEHKHSPIITETPSFPGKAIVKASLFDVISRPDEEVFTDRRQAWEEPVEGAKQE
ncbi:hypothetical protein APSETT445_001013 [Aspergillus pseudonomiae]